MFHDELRTPFSSHVCRDRLPENTDSQTALETRAERPPTRDSHAALERHAAASGRCTPCSNPFLSERDHLSCFIGAVSGGDLGQAVKGANEPAVTGLTVSSKPWLTEK